MLHNTGPYGPNETPVNMGAPLNISQLSTPMKMVQNLNNLAKMPPQAGQTASGHFNLPSYPSYNNPPMNVSPQMHSFQNYHPLGFQHNYLPDRSSVMLNPSWPSHMQPLTMNMPEDHAQNMLNYSHMDKRLPHPSETYKEDIFTSKPTLNIPQVPNKLYQTHSEPVHNPQNTFNNHYKPYDMCKDENNVDDSLKSPENLLSDNTRRKNLENTVRLIENILINTTKNREMQLNNEIQEDSQSSSHYNSEKQMEMSETHLPNESVMKKIQNDTDDELDGQESDEDDAMDVPNDSLMNSERSNEKMKCNIRRCSPDDKAALIETAKTLEVVLEPLKEKDDEFRLVKIKQEPIEMEKEVEVKIEQIVSWTDTDSMNPFHRDVNGVMREDTTHTHIIDSEVSVIEAMEVIKNGIKSECYFECPHCSLLFEQPKRFLIHTKWHSFGLINKQRNDLAKEKEERKEALRRERLVAPPGDQVWPCKLCDKVFYAKGSLDSHRQRSHSNRVRECKMCDKRVTGWSAWKSHLASHNTDAGFQCNECPKRFKYAHSLAKHKDTHLEKTHGCEECPKKFGSQALLKVHMKSHERAKIGATFHCTYCGKSFYDKFNLQIHERTHTNERPFVCEICNATFGCNSNLSRHLKVSHSASKPHVCSTCNRSFATELIRDRHELRVHGDPEEFKYTCKQCPSRYMKLVDLRKHTYKMHPKPKLEKSEK